MKGILSKGLVLAALAGGMTQVASAQDFGGPQLVFLDAPVAISVFTPPPGSVIPLFPNNLQGGPNPQAGVVGTGGGTYMVDYLLDSKGQQAGISFISCSEVATNSAVGNEPPGQIRLCNQILSVYGKGQIMLTGILSDGLKQQTLAITGGTGLFAHATGQVVITEPTEHSHAYNVYFW